MPLYLVIGAVVAVAAAGVLARRTSRRQLLARIRADWGKRSSRSQKLGAIAEACRSRMAASGDVSFLDDRTWEDLDMDAVLAAIDRTQSTLGQQALYHRLRTAPVSDHLDAFEALVTRMSGDAPARERAQLALARPQDPHGYDLWRLARAGTFEHHAWYAVFPLLTAATVAIALLTLHWHALLPVLIAPLVIDLGIRVITAQKVNALGSAFRQIAPIVATGGGPLHPKPHAVLAATHDAELVDLLRDACRAYHFADKIGPNGLVFEYRLEPGPATTRNAITLLQLRGAPASVVRRALTRAEALDHLRRLQFESP